jgi:predicted NAD/FAD-dependent oxidoreductase
MTPGCKVPALEPGPDRFFLCGDFYYYPSVEAAVVSGQTVAQRIVERHG